MELIHRMPCCCELGVSRDGKNYADSMCGGDIEANHAGEKPGVGLKAPDDTCIPMCNLHHRDWTDHNGLFRYWARNERRARADKMIDATRAAAIPGDNYDAALDLQNLGLGRIEHVANGGWRWVPVTQDSEAGR
jgi:hypothetical protein